MGPGFLIDTKPHNSLIWNQLDNSNGGVYNTHMNTAEIIKRLKREGWTLHNVRGSHHQYKHLHKKRRVTVPHPKKDLPIGTYKSICKQAGWEYEK